MVISFFNFIQDFSFEKKNSGLLRINIDLRSSFYRALQKSTIQVARRYRTCKRSRRKGADRRLTRRKHTAALLRLSSWSVVKGCLRLLFFVFAQSIPLRFDSKETLRIGLRFF